MLCANIVFGCFFPQVQHVHLPETFKRRGHSLTTVAR